MKCKRIIAGIVSLMLALSAVTVPAEVHPAVWQMTAAAEEETLDPGLAYKNCGDHIEITGYQTDIEYPYGAHLSIPDEIEWLPVTKICPGACKGITRLYEVWLPFTLEEIGDEAFAECFNLSRVHYSLNLRSIGKRAFYHCRYMTDLNLPDKLEEIGEEAFAQCSQINYVVLPDSLRTIRRGVFADDAYLSAVSIPASVERIESNAFSGCQRLNGVCYKGSADAWAVLSVGSGNECLHQGELICDYNKQKVARSTVFDPEKDTWGFLNKDVEYYVLSKESLAEMTSNMNVMHQQQTNLFWEQYQEIDYQGACVGLAMTSLLASAGILDPSELDTDAKCLHDVRLTDEVRELITYYQMLQGNESFINAMDIRNRKKLYDYLNQGIPVFFWYQGSYTNDKGRTVGFGHAVVAYGVEEGRFEFDGNVFQKKILTYDNNVNEENGRDGNIYLEPENTEWQDDVFPAHQKIYIPYMEEKQDLKVTYNPPAYNIDYLNLHGKNKGTAYTEPELKCALLRTPVLPAAYSVQSYPLDDPKNRTDAVMTQVKAGDYQALQCQDGQKGYVLEMQDKQALDCSMSYEIWLYTVNGSDLTSAAFVPDGSVSITGEDMQYQLTMTANKTEHPACCDELYISGAHTDAVSVRQTEDGYVIAGENRHDVTVDARNGSRELALTFSTDTGEVLVHETGRNTLAVSADLDHNGTFETVLASAFVPDLGDVNGDGYINAKDANAVLLAAARIGTGNDSGLTEAQQKAADADQDGSINSVDAAWILRYAAAVGTGSVQDGLDAFVKSNS